MDTDWWWIDYLENELELSLERDLEMLLQHSQEDRDSFENFRLLKQWVKESDPVAAWPLEERAERMRKNVMAAIADAEMDLAPAAVGTKRRDRLRAAEVSGPR